MPPTLALLLTLVLPAAAGQQGGAAPQAAQQREAGDPARHLPGPAGYALPVVDLGGETARQVEVDREPGQYLGHVTTALLDDGRTIVAVYPKGHGGGAIVLKRSTDGGRTWSERLPVPDSWATSKEVPTIFRIEDADGRLERLVLFSGLAPIRMAHSGDGGVTWSELEPVGDYGGIVACSSLIRLQGGRHLATFHDDGRFLGNAVIPEDADGTAHPPEDGHPFHVYAITSEDGGLTWSAPRVIAAHPRAHLCEPLILRSPDGGRLLCLMRENSRRYNGFFMTSDDEGATWSEPRQLPAALTGDRHTGGFAPDGRLFLSFRDTTRRSPTKGDWVGWVGTWEDVLAGRSGQLRVRLEDNHHRWDCAYPGVALLPGGRFVCTTYGHWTPGEEPWILSLRLRLEELDRRVADGAVIPNPPNPAATPAPRSEEWWRDRQETLNMRAVRAAADEERMDVVFLGDSITHGWEGAGAPVWEEHWGDLHTLNLGIGGDRTQHVLWRLEHGNLEELRPRLCVLMIGTNNAASDAPADVADGIFAILRRLRRDQPQMKILLLEIFPRGSGPDDRLRRANDEVNRMIAIAAADPMIEVLDLAPVFLEEDGTLPESVMPDLLHPNEHGYRLWAEALAPRVEALLGRTAGDRSEAAPAADGG